MNTNKVMCPKCNTKNLRMLDREEIIGHTCPVKCDNCYLVFGWYELNKYWNIDVGDFYDIDTESVGYIPEPEWENFDTFLKSRFGYPYLYFGSPDYDVKIDYGFPVGAVGSS